MENLILYAHPNPQSFNRAILETIEDRLTQNGEQYNTRDLYAMNFDPILKHDDFTAFAAGKPTSDIAAEQNYIRRAKTIIVIHPIWWFNAPAILKGYIDRVFSYGFAYAVKDKAITGLLTDKRVFIINTTGGSAENYKNFGFAESLKTTMQNGIYSFCGMKIEKHIFFHEVPTIAQEARIAMLQELKKMNF